MLAIGVSCFGASLPAAVAAPAGPHEVEMSWMSIANWYFKLGDLRIVMDGYITRVPGSPFFVASTEFPADQFAFTQGPYNVDVASVTRVSQCQVVNGPALRARAFRPARSRSGDRRLSRGCRRGLSQWRRRTRVPFHD